MHCTGKRGADAERLLAAQQLALEAVPAHRPDEGMAAVVEDAPHTEVHKVSQQTSCSPEPPSSQAIPGSTGQAAAQATAAGGQALGACGPPDTHPKPMAHSQRLGLLCGTVAAAPFPPFSRAATPSPGATHGPPLSLSTSRSRSSSWHSLHISEGDAPGAGVVVGCCMGRCGAMSPRTGASVLTPSQPSASSAGAVMARPGCCCIRSAQCTPSGAQGCGGGRSSM